MCVGGTGGTRGAAGGDGVGPEGGLGVCLLSSTVMGGLGLVLGLGLGLGYRLGLGYALGFPLSFCSRLPL